MSFFSTIIGKLGFERFSGHTVSLATVEGASII